MTAAAPQVMVDDGRIRVTRWHFEPGASTGMHTHEFDYVVVPITGGNFIITQPDDSKVSMLQLPGESYSRSVGVTHDVTNAGHQIAVFVEIELLTE
ncbi:MAG: cupin [Actinobacteria bacterium]|nr:MAG: cupin [Actinomycetota bacterium]